MDDEVRTLKFEVELMQREIWHLRELLATALELPKTVAEQCHGLYPAAVLANILEAMEQLAEEIRSETERSEMAW